MAQSCQLYYITDRKQFQGDERKRCQALLDKISEAARAGVEYIQLREKDLSTRELEALARECAAQLQKLRTENRALRTRFLINSRTDVALAAGADGVHLRSEDILPSEARSIWDESSARDSRFAARISTIAVSCHFAIDVERAAAERPDFAVFAPVFEKRDAPQVHPRGLEALHEACAAKVPVLALGGVTIQNAPACLAAGAAGIAGIRLFQENKVEEVVRMLRAIEIQADARS